MHRISTHSQTDCRDIIDTYTTENAKKFIADYDQGRTPASYQEYQEINQYLESIGKKNDEEKMAHISQTLSTASHSLDSYDKNLENIMLKYSPLITSGKYTIEKSDNKIIASDSYGKYDITEYAVSIT